MLSQHRAAAAIAYTLAAASCALLLGAAGPTSADTATGQFVSYEVNPSGGSITIQQGERLMVFSMAANATTRERGDETEWRATSPAEIAQGEAVTLSLNSAGLVQQIDATYTTVTTRLVTQKNGFLVTTSGKAYKLVGRAAQVQATLTLGTYLRLRVDPSTDTAFDLSASSQPFTGVSLAQPIAVTIIVSVPLNTPSRDIVYIAADVANWVPNGVRMTPLTGNRWTATLTLGKGASMKYKYTRGSWGTAETNRSGIEIPNRSLTISKTANTQQVEDVVVRWSDLPS
ncbi:MAG TPA: CBM20 domain-containing protein [Candidatus Eremiobacteraceae bacterium]|jgi:hypothetical protein|nr:CBM20 domain-containing protein [Candidatus Eremiobacteraceae bacterium]